MERLDLSQLSIPDAQLIQRGLAAVGFYEGTFRGNPGRLTEAAYGRYLASFSTVAPTIPVVPSIPGAPTASGSIVLGDRLAEILLTKVGVVEIPRNSNRGPDVEAFQASTWLDGTGWAWCAAFVCWGMQKLEAEIDYPFTRPETAAAYGFEDWAKKQGLKMWKPCGQIKRGDILIFGPFSHIAVAVADEKFGSVETVEGNTDGEGSREGNGVYRKRRDKNLFRSHIRLELKTPA